MRVNRAVISSMVLALAASTSASAQDAGDDWDFGQDAARDLTMAAVTFDNFGLAVRCLSGNVSVVVSGLQVSEGQQNVRFGIGGRTDDDSAWVGSPDGRTLFSLWPVAVASDLKEGGTLVLGVQNGERVRRVSVDIPSSPAAIDRVLSACGREATPTGSIRADGVSLNGLRWISQPQPSFPDRAASEGGLAALTCTTDRSGAPRNCRIESEFPEGRGFGRAAVLGAHRNGRVALTDGATGRVEGRTISFLVRYGLQSPQPGTQATLEP